MNIEHKVDINPSYEWSEDAKELGISHRELEVFALVAEGYSNKEVAKILDIKHQSVKNHMHNFTKKLRVKNSAQALIVAIHMNLVKMRSRFAGVVNEFSKEDMIEQFRKVLSGEVRSSNINEKDKKDIKVWLKSHGIEVDNW